MQKKHRMFLCRIKSEFQLTRSNLRCSKPSENYIAHYSLSVREKCHGIHKIFPRKSEMKFAQGITMSVIKDGQSDRQTSRAQKKAHTSPLQESLPCTSSPSLYLELSLRTALFILLKWKGMMHYLIRMKLNFFRCIMLW